MCEIVEKTSGAGCVYVLESHCLTDWLLEEMNINCKLIRQKDFRLKLGRIYYQRLFLYCKFQNDLGILIKHKVPQQRPLQRAMSSHFGEHHKVKSLDVCHHTYVFKTRFCEFIHLLKFFHFFILQAAFCNPALMHFLNVSKTSYFINCYVCLPFGIPKCIFVMLHSQTLVISLQIVILTSSMYCLS